MRRNDSHPIVSLVTDEPADRLMRRVLAFHLWQGWRVKRGVAVLPEAVPESFEMRSCIDPDCTVEVADMPRDDYFAFEFHLEPTPLQTRQGGNPRLLQLGRCSIGCTFGQHPVEVWLPNESRSRALASLRDLYEALLPAWAVLVSSNSRGPSGVEARSPGYADRVSLEAVYISDRLLEGNDGIVCGLESVPWHGGIFVSGHESSVSDYCFPLFQRWALSR